MNKTPRPVETSSPISDNRHAEEISSDDEDAVKAPARRRRRNVVTSEIESDNESESASASTPTRRQQSSDSEASEQRTETSRRPSTRRLRSRRAVQEEDSETEIRSLPQTRSVTRGQQNGTEALSPTKRTKSSAVDLSGLASAETSDADELVTRPTGRKRRAAEPSATFVVDDDSDDSDDVVVSSPAKRRRRENVSEEPRTPRKTSEQDRLDLEEDLRDLQDSGKVDFAKYTG